MYVLWRTLTFRNRHSELFSDAEYIPLRTSGEHAEQVLAFARRYQSEVAVIAVPRFCACLLQCEPRLPGASETWHDTRIELPETAVMSFRNLFTGDSLHPESANGIAAFSAAQLFADFPVALLTSVAESQKAASAVRQIEGNRKG